MLISFGLYYGGRWAPRPEQEATRLTGDCRNSPCCRAGVPYESAHTAKYSRAHHFRISQEFLAHILGMRGVGLTKAAHALKKRKLIDYSRGNIVILNERGLETASCSWYELVQE